MVKVLRCSDVIGNCDFVAKGESEQEILQQASEHARTAHNLHEITPEVADKVKSAIRDEAA
ncbi:MAG TPA: DUF1059 domain-containing protein [Terriglobales bacterium]|nr:DUF1059 domain-containing protein [Terriglobales bacterium]